MTSNYVSPTRRKKIERLQRRCDNWNAKYPIGTRVKHFDANEVARKEFTTRSPAHVLGNHTAVVLLNGLPGQIALDVVTPIEPEKYVSPFVKDDRVQLVDDWYNHHLRKSPIAGSPSYGPARGEVGTVLSTPRTVY